MTIHVVTSCCFRQREFIELILRDNSPRNYFTDVVELTSKVFAKSGVPVAVHVGRVDLPSNQTISLDSLAGLFPNNSNNGIMLGRTVRVYWSHDNWKRLLNLNDNCHFGVLVTQDALLKGHVIAGYANIASLCSYNPYGLLQLQMKKSSTSELLAHELGHALGMYHDDEVAPSHYTSADVRDKCKGNDQTHIMARATRTAGFNVNDNWMGPKTSHAVAMSRFDKKTMIKFYKGNVSPTRPARLKWGVFSECSKAMMREWAKVKKPNCMKRAHGYRTLMDRQSS
ncbi:hypothetical protein LSAT2_019596 [Lamellibrachia satsuma]|nr:hypothetical protein LSAT2_019596 [Lamellibrachia satsuma]